MGAYRPISTARPRVTRVETHPDTAKDYLVESVMFVEGTDCDCEPE